MLHYRDISLDNFLDSLVYLFTFFGARLLASLLNLWITPGWANSDVQ